MSLQGVRCAQCCVVGGVLHRPGSAGYEVGEREMAVVVVGEKPQLGRPPCGDQTPVLVPQHSERPTISRVHCVADGLFVLLHSP